MSPFDYVMVLASVILGLAITHILQSLVAAIQSETRVRFYWVHLAWVAYFFLFAVFWWWWQYALRLTPVWTFERFSFVLLYAVLLYLLAALIIPSKPPADGDYEAYFFRRRKWFFGFGLLVPVVDLVDTWAKGPERLASLGPSYLVWLAVFFAGYCIGIWTSDRRYHAAFVLAVLAYQLFFIFRAFNTVG